MITAITIPNAGAIEKLKALVVNIVSPETKVQAQGYLTDVRLAGKRLEQDIRTLKRPHQDAIKEIDAAAKPLKDLLAERDGTIERAILAYDRKQREDAEKAQRLELEKYERKVEKAEQKAVEQGKPMPVVLPPRVIAPPPKSVEVEGAKQTVVRRKAWRLAEAPAIQVSDIELDRDSPQARLVPNQYFVLDTARIGKVVRAGGQIQGIEVYEEESIAVKAS